MGIQTGEQQVVKAHRAMVTGSQQQGGRRVEQHDAWPRMNDKKRKKALAHPQIYERPKLSDARNFAASVDAPNLWQFRRLAVAAR